MAGRSSAYPKPCSMVGDTDLCADLSEPERAAEMFDATGVCWFEEALPPTLVDECCESYEPRRVEIDAALAARGVDLHTQFRFDEICRRRYSRYDVRGYGISGRPFQDPLLWSAAQWMPFVRCVLGPDACERWRGVVDNRPGSDMQGWHRDGDHVFEHVHLPPHCLTIWIPLVDVHDESCGPTQFYPGSHATWRAEQYVGLAEDECHLPNCTPRLDRGSVLAFDYRVIHRGTPNTSSAGRPILYIVFSRPWFCDALSFPTDAPLLAGLPGCAAPHDARAPPSGTADRDEAASGAGWTREQQLQERLELQDMYDEYAETYEAELLQGLLYRTPQRLEEALLSRPGRLSDDVTAGVLSHLDALDIGCGTGLMGVLLRARCRGRLLGCDLSERMLAVGKESHPGVYDGLAASDGVAYLRARPAGSADLVVAADVFPYMGSLADVLAAAQAALCVGGVLAFSTEAARLDECGGAGEGDGSAQAPRASRGWVKRAESQRTAHSAEYLCWLVAEASSELELCALSNVELRRDEGAVIRGFAVLLIKRARGGG